MKSLPVIFALELFNERRSVGASSSGRPNMSFKDEGADCAIRRA